MSAIIGTAVKGNEAGSAVSSPANITDVVNSFQSDGTTNVITWQNIAIWLGARAAADLANVKLATLESGVVPGSQLPFTGFEFRGDYNPATNTPALANADTGKANWVYRITGSANPTARDFGAGSINCSDDDYLAYSGDSGAGAWINIGQGATKQVAEGGTGATTAAGARTNLELLSEDEVNDRANARQPVNGVYYDGTAKNDASNNAATDAGTGDLTIAALVTFPDSVSTTNTIAGTRTTSAGYQFFQRASGALGIMGQDTSSNAVSSTDDGDSLVGRTAHVVAVIDRAANTFTRYVDGIQYGSVDDCSALVATLTNANGFHMGHRSSDFFLDGGIIHSVVPYNRALTAAQVLKLAMNGNVPEVADKWGGADGGIYTQDTTPAGEWSTSQVTTANTAGPLSGKSDYLTVTLSGGSQSTHGVYLSSLSIGQRYRVSGAVYVSSSNVAVDGLRVQQGQLNSAAQLLQDYRSITTNAWQSFEVEFVATGSTSWLNIQAQAGNSYSVNADGDEYHVAEVKITEIGATAAYLPENILPTGNINDPANGLRAIGTNVTPLKRPSSGQFTEEIELAHGSISSSAATTELLDLPKGCRVVSIETIIDAAFDGSTTLDIGISGTGDKYANNIDVASTARRFNSNSNASESDTATTSIYVQKNQATTSGNAKFRVTYEITAPTV